MSAPSRMESDFLFWPKLFDEDESREMLEMGLWKLDRADSTRKRRRRSDPKLVSQAGTGTDLQDLFEGEYGFEEVNHQLYSGN